MSNDVSVQACNTPKSLVDSFIDRMDEISSILQDVCNLVTKALVESAQNFSIESQISIAPNLIKQISGIVEFLHIEFEWLRYILQNHSNMLAEHHKVALRFVINQISEMQRFLEEISDSLRVKSIAMKKIYEAVRLAIIDSSKTNAIISIYNNLPYNNKPLNIKFDIKT